MRRFTAIIQPLLFAALLAPNIARCDISPWSAAADLGYASKLYRIGNASRSSSLGLEGKIGYQISDQVKLQLSDSFSRELEDEESTLVDDGTLGISHKGWELTKDLSLSAGARFVVPLSKESRKVDNLYTAVSLAPTLKADLSAITKGLSLTDSLSFSRSFHEYTVSATGRPKRQYNIANTVGLGITFLKKFSFSVSYMSSVGWTYHGNRLNSFDIITSLDYQASDPLSFYLAHRNRGNSLAVNGQDSAVRISDPNTATYSGGIVYAL